ncbi:hypothetical protein BCR34DRAFT_592802 [Clohesyomyces aquaticus]|uniref:SWIM-type domain-containing protein n=1 Tax=Clohesyomyces aquaticus TaxID=1231657 RepID=A0A1Y1YPC0_9PLEO|nr:hypothetical protein BCR34DRAFT_592802 [Clohesyomyces aquaticus]
MSAAVTAVLPSSRTFITNLINALALSHHPTLPSASENAEAGYIANNTAPASSENPLISAPESVRKQILALHVLFPNELLPALDLLDRRLVTRLLVHEPDAREDEGAGDEDRDGDNGRAENAETGRVDAAQDPDPALRNVTVEAQEDGMSASAPTRAEHTYRGKLGTHSDGTDTLMSEPGVQLALPYTDSTQAHTIYYVRSAQPRSSRYTSSYDTTTSYEVRLNAWNCSCPAFAFSAFPATSTSTVIPPPSPSSFTEGKHTEWCFGGLSLGSGIPPVCKHLLACVLVERGGYFEKCVLERRVCGAEAAGWAAGWGD